MDTVNISTFKAGCIALLKKLQRKGTKPLVVTSRGEPIAIIYPYTKEKPRRILGGQADSFIVKEDFSGADLSGEWEALEE
jgi:antitoxin (DNA-binding transcriptional repressor) of toxin-antitoxin stability system